MHEVCHISSRLYLMVFNHFVKWNIVFYGQLEWVIPAGRVKCRVIDEFCLMATLSVANKRDKLYKRSI